MRILLAPSFGYGVWNPGKESTPDRRASERKTLHRALNELLAKWEDHGIQEFLILTAYQHRASSGCSSHGHDFLCHPLW